MIRCGWLTLFCLAAGCGQAAREQSGGAGSWAIAGATSLGGQSGGANGASPASGNGNGNGGSLIAGNGATPNSGNGGSPRAGNSVTPNGGNGAPESTAGGSMSTVGNGGAADASNGVISMCSSSTSAETRIALQVATDLDEALNDVTVTTRVNDEFASTGLSVSVTLADVQPPGAASIDAWRVNSVSPGALIGLTVGVYPPLPHVQVTVDLVSASHGILATGSVLVVPFDWSSCGKVG